MTTSMQSSDQGQYQGNNRRKWSLKKEISIVDILTFLSAGFAVVYAYTTLDKRLTVVELETAQQVRKDDRQDADSLRYQARIDEQFKTINAKLDRLLESRSGSGSGGR